MTKKGIVVVDKLKPKRKNGPRIKVKKYEIISEMANGKKNGKKCTRNKDEEYYLKQDESKDDTLSDIDFNLDDY